MPKTVKPSTSAAKSYQKPPKQPKPELTEDERVQRLWHSIYDQLAGPLPFPAKALKNVEKILKLKPDDHFARITKTQLLAGLDKYKDAMTQLGAGEATTSHPLERAYSLYKLGKEREALDLVLKTRAADATLDDTQGRGLRLLEAQLQYRLEDYAAAHSIYEELLDTVEPDAPEYADLETNLAACAAHLDFLSSIPSRLSALSDTLPPVATLEATPLNVLLASNASSKPSASRAHPRPPFSTTAGSSAAPSTKRKKKERPPHHPRPTKLPAHIAALAPEKRPPPDPERWLPQSERSTWPARRAELEKARERRRAEKRRNARTQTQGMATGDEQASRSATPTVSTGANRRKGKR